MSASSSRRRRAASSRRTSPVPRTQLLSNGRYAVMMTAAGSGYSRWRDLAVTRWREDATCDGWGTYIFLRDARQRRCVVGGLPAERQSSRIVTRRRSSRIAPKSSGATARSRPRWTWRSRRRTTPRSAASRSPIAGRRAREIEVTSYAEIVLAPDAADTAHPAFSNLFVQTEFVADIGALLATRRRAVTRRAAGLGGASRRRRRRGGRATRNSKPTGRAFSGADAASGRRSAVIDGRPLSNTAGAVLDPIFSLRRRVRLAPGATARIAFWTLVAASRSEVLDLADKHHDAAAFERAVTLAWTQAQVQLFHLGIDSDEASLFQRLANHVLYSEPGAAAVIRSPRQRSEGGPSALWAHGISGDLPIVAGAGSTTSRICRSSASCCAPTNTGG